MPNYLQFVTPDSGVVLVEIEESAAHSSEVGRTGLGEVVDRTVGKAQETFVESLHVIGETAKAFLQQVRKLADSPDEVEVTFGLKASGEFGNFAIAKASGEANYTVKLVWKNRSAA